MENLDALFVISLDCNPREEHVSHLSESQRSMRVDENDLGRSHVYIPFSKVGTHEHQQVNDIGEGQWYRGEKDRVESHTFEHVLSSGVVLIDLGDNELLKSRDIEEILIAREINSKSGKTQEDN